MKLAFTTVLILKSFNMSTGMLPKFHVRNLRSSNQPVEKTDSLGSLVKISAPAYDMTISNNPAATLKYRDEDGDKITVCVQNGSSSGTC